MPSHFTGLPTDLPVPIDDCACVHLLGMRLPTLSLRATTGELVALQHLSRTTVLYFYPRTGGPGEPSPPGWDEIPGARGCTPQSCAFRDHHAELEALGASVYGVSAQETEYQREAATRLALPFPLLADPELQVAAVLRMPTFEAAGTRLYKRVTLVARDAEIVKVFYPVFPPDRNTDEVIAWLESGTRAALA